MHDSRRTRLVLGVLLIIAIALITLDFRDGGASPARNVGADVFGPIERVTHDVTDPVASLFDSITGGPSAQSTIANLQQENAALRAQLSSAQLSKTARQQLTQLLQLDAGGYRIVAANVIAAGGDYSDTVTLDVGRSDGIKPDETVLNGSGFVGTVTQVSEDTSTVLLADDASSVIGVQLRAAARSAPSPGPASPCPGRPCCASPCSTRTRCWSPGSRSTPTPRWVTSRRFPACRWARSSRSSPAPDRYPDGAGPPVRQLHRPRRGRRRGPGAQAQPEDLDPAASRPHGHDHRHPQPVLLGLPRPGHLRRRPGDPRPPRRRRAAADGTRAHLLRGRQRRGRRPAHHRRPDRLPRRGWPRRGAARGGRAGPGGRSDDRRADRVLGRPGAGRRPAGQPLRRPERAGVLPDRLRCAAWPPTSRTAKGYPSKGARRCSRSWSPRPGPSSGRRWPPCSAPCSAIRG